MIPLSMRYVRGEDWHEGMEGVTRVWDLSKPSMARTYMNLWRVDDKKVTGFELEDGTRIKLADVTDWQLVCLFRSRKVRSGGKWKRVTKLY